MSNQKPTIKPILIVCIVVIGGYFLLKGHKHKRQQSKAAAPTIAQPKLNSTNITIQPGDTLDSTFASLQIDRSKLRALLKTKSGQKYLGAIHPGDKITFFLTPANKLAALQTIADAEHYIRFSFSPDEVTKQFVSRPYLQRLQSYSFAINKGLNQDLASNKLPASTSYKLQNIFGDKFDFRRNLHRGDTIQVLLQQRKYNGSTKTENSILAASIIEPTKKLEAIKFNNTYYQPSGNSLRNGMDRVPLKYDHISSPFSLHRMHPILHIIRPHYGVDLAAKMGTPIHATGNGRIIFIGKAGGYGNFIKIQHAHHFVTEYGHLQKFAKGLHYHSYVHRGQLIAYLGMTGLATGPHIHYEVRHYNIPHDPMKIKLPQAAPVPHNQKAKFKQLAKVRLQQLVDHTGLQPWVNGNG